jgi:hypothetical protein
MYNTYRARIIYAEEQHQVLVVSVKARGHDMASAIEQLEQFRLDLTECFKLALEEIGDRGSELTGNVMYIPMHLRHGNTNSMCRSLLHSPVCL